MPNNPTPDQIPLGFKLRHTLRGHKDAIFYIVWSPDGETLTSGSEDGCIKLWDTRTRELSRTIQRPAGQANSLMWSPDGRTLVFGGRYGTIQLWNVVTGKLRRTLGEPADQINSVAWSSDGGTLALGGADGFVKLLDTVEWKPRRILARHSGPVLCVAWSPDGRTLASGSADGIIRLRDSVVGQPHLILEGHSGPVLCAAWSPDGRTLASGGSDGIVHLWDTITGHLMLTIESSIGSVSSVTFSSNGQLLASESSQGTVQFWRCDLGRHVTLLDEPASEFLMPGLTFHPAEPALATIGEEGSVVHIWDVDFDIIFGAAQKRDDVLYTTAKVTLVGDSGVGKTGLGWRIAHGEFKEHSSTHGQQFWTIDELGATREDGTQCEAVLWDLAGQPDYRLVHALFLDDVDLALVLFDPTNRQEPLKGVEYWLKQLARERFDGRTRRVILVGARGDRGAPTLTREELDEFCSRHGVDDYIATSALTGEGLEELLARVKSSIVWDEMPATVTTRTFKRVKEYVLSLKAETERKGVLVNPAELRARLEATDVAWEFTDAVMMTAVRHLSNHGYVAVLRGSSGEETILLAPDLLANLAASFILEARRNPKGLGALEEARVLAGAYEFPECAGLDEGERDVLLDASVVLFIEHNLCFRATLGTQTLLIFPALINQKRPVIKEVKTVDDVSYRVTGAVENVYAALVVQLGYTNTFTRTNQWQNQAEYETAHGDVCGFRQVNEREGETELVLYYAKERAGARLLFQGLFEEFLRGRDVDVTKFPPVRCPKCRYRQQRAEVVKRISEGKGFLFCGECGKKIALPAEGERVTLSRAEREQLGREQERTRRRTAFESALVRVKAVVRDESKRAPSCFVSYAWGEHERERWVRGLAVDLQNAGVDVLLDQKDNAWIGSNVGRFISRVEDEEIDFVAVVGTPLYLEKYKNELSPEGSVVASEVDLINLRMTSTKQRKNTVLPLLVQGEAQTALPPLLRGRVRADFRDEAAYFGTLYDLILTLYRIPFDHPAVADLRDKLRAGEERLR